MRAIRAVEDYMDRYQFNTRERLNVLGGTLLGVMAPITYVRYMGFPDSEGSLTKEAMYWLGATGAALPLTPVGAFFGVLAGVAQAQLSNTLRKEKHILRKRT